MDGMEVMDRKEGIEGEEEEVVMLKHDIRKIKDRDGNFMRYEEIHGMKAHEGRVM